MTPAPAAPDRKKGGLDLRHPGAKEYLIVGGAVLGLALVYFWWKGKQAPAPAAGGGKGSPGTATGLSTGDLVTWMHDHAGSPPRRPRPRSHPVREPGPGGVHRREDHDRDDRHHARMPPHGPPHHRGT